MLSLSDNINKLVFVVSEPCNLNCVYCYARLSSDARTGGIMSPEAARKIIRKILSGRRQCAFVQFFGGEPSLNLDAIEAAVIEILRMFDEGFLDNRPRFPIVTNGVWVNPDRTIDLIMRYGIETTVSLDGPPDIHNALRPMKNSAQTYDRVIRTIDELMKADMPLAVESVYTALHVTSRFSIVDLMKFVHGLGVKKLIFEPAYPPAPSDVSPFIAPHFDTMLAYYREAVDWWFQRLMAGDNILDLYFKDMLLSFIKGTPASVAESGCLAGSKDITIGPDGDMYACHLLYGNPGYWSGNVLYDIFQGQAVGFPVKADDIDACRACHARHWCQPCAAINDSWGNAWIAASPECIKRQSVISRIGELALKYLVVPDNGVTADLRDMVNTPE